MSPFNRSPGIASKLRARWQALDLAAQFAVTAVAVIGTGMALLGWWVAGRIERGVIAHAAASAALHMDVFIETHVQDLIRSNTLSASSEKALSSLIARSHQGNTRVVGITIWNKNGSAVYSTDPMTANSVGPQRIIATAWNGEIPSTFETKIGYSARTGASGSGAILKVFAPMHSTGTNRVIAVAELNAANPALASDIRQARFDTVAVAGLLSLAMVASLFGIVRRGSRVIGEQQLALEARVRDLTESLEENDRLQSRIGDINRRAADRNDKALRRVGAELHDGPVQLIALSLLRLESLRIPELSTVERRNHDDFDAVETALRDALKEIRDLCSGLALPNLEKAPISKVIEYAVMNHERRSKTQVARIIASDLPASAPPLTMMCVYRFIQEGLTNALRHAGGKDQIVAAAFDGQLLTIEVADSGPGMTASDLEPARFASGHGLGLAGLKDRIETVGGSFTISSALGQGTRLTAVVEINPDTAPSLMNSGIVVQ
ncbi:MAG: ATP-binding protein [Hyphomicrobium sp.]